MHSHAYTCTHVHFGDFTCIHMRSPLLISLQLPLQFENEANCIPRQSHSVETLSTHRLRTTPCRCWASTNVRGRFRTTPRQSGVDNLRRLLRAGEIRKQWRSTVSPLLGIFSKIRRLQGVPSIMLRKYMDRNFDVSYS